MVLNLGSRSGTHRVLIDSRIGLRVPHRAARTEEVRMNTIPKHRVDRSETPWWWFGQPWQRATMTTTPGEDLPPDNDDEPYTEPEPPEEEDVPDAAPAEEKSWAHVS
jgi:hypothetical protein